MTKEQALKLEQEFLKGKYVDHIDYSLANSKGKYWYLNLAKKYNLKYIKEKTKTSERFEIYKNNEENKKRFQELKEKKRKYNNERNKSHKFEFRIYKWLHKIKNDFMTDKANKWKVVVKKKVKNKRLKETPFNWSIREKISKLKR